MPQVRISSLPDLSAQTKSSLTYAGYQHLCDLDGIRYKDLLAIVSFDQAKKVLIHMIDHEVNFVMEKPEWDENDWSDFVKKLISSGIVSWREVALCICSELNPPQVGTAVAMAVKHNYPPRGAMKNVMKWFYSQKGVCENCGTRLYLEADHIVPKEDYERRGEDIKEADNLDNYQLLCKRCNVTKRGSHKLGGLSFSNASSVLIWIIIEKEPATKEDFYKMCRDYGLTMANIRFDEAWAFVKWFEKK